ncbi:MAG: sigma-70 family RNA polymerase sigma factor [Planctomycetota bacterium]
MEKIKTLQLIEMWHAGDRKGLDLLIENHLPWIMTQIEKRMTVLLSRKGESLDYVQEAILQFLKYAPRFVINDGAEFRALLFRIAENSMNMQYRWFTAQRRDVARERPLPSDTILLLDPPKKSMKTPSTLVDHHEREAWVRLALEFLNPDDREAIVLRRWEGLTFGEAGERLGLSEDGARMRYNRALIRLGEKVWALRTGGVKKAMESEAVSSGSI